MPLDKQIVPISLGQGFDSKSDPKQVVPGKMLVLENGVFTSPGRTRKRNGYRALGQGIVGSVSTIDDGQGLASYQDELCLFDTDSFYSYDAGNDAWVDKGGFTSVHVTQRPVVRNTYQQTAQDSATHADGLQCFAWEDTQGGVRYSVIDSATGLNVAANALVHASGSRPKVIAFGNHLLIFFVLSGTSSLYYAEIGVGAPTTLHTPVLVTNALGALNYDAVVIGMRCFVAWSKSGGNVQLKYYLTTLTASAATTIAEAAPTCLTAFAGSDGASVVIAWHDGNRVRFAAYDYSLSLLHAATTAVVTAGITSITGVATPGSSSLFRLFYTRSATAKHDYLVRTCLVTAYVPAADSTLLRSVGLAGKAFQYGGLSYVPVAHENTLQSTYFMANESGDLVAKVFYGLGGGIPTRSQLPGVAALSDTQFQVSCLVKDLLATDAGNVFTQTGVSIATFDFFDAANSYLSAELGLNLHVGGGFLQMYDGVSPVEHGFHLYPEGLTVASEPPGSFLFDDAVNSGEIFFF